jgi:hypothetical protein
VPGIDFDNHGSLHGRSAAEIEDVVPADWRSSMARNRLAKRFADPLRPGDQIRAMQGNPADPDPVKRGPYVRVSRSGKVFDPVPLPGNPFSIEGAG